MRGIVTAVLLALAAATGMTAQAKAVGFCDCCKQELGQSCQAACTGQMKEPGQCTAVVDYSGKGDAAKGKNPLNGVSLRDLSAGNPTAAQLELLRRFLEASRRRAMADYSRAARRLRRGRISQDAFASAKALYREAMVNYYHGISAYLIKVGAKSE